MILLPCLGIGGAEKLVLDECLELRKESGLHLEVHAVFDGGPIAEALSEAGVPVTVWGAPHKSLGMLWTHARITHYLRKQKFHVVHCHVSYALGPLVGRLARVTTLVTVHSSRPMTRLQRWGLRLADMVFACGREVGTSLKGTVQPEKLQILRNAIRPPGGGKHARHGRTLAEYRVDSGQFVIFSAGRLIPEKAFDQLLMAFSLIAEDCPQSALLIAGDGPEMGRLTTLAKRLGVGDRVQLLGTVAELRPLYERADVYVNCSHTEGLPMTLIEAMAYGLPIVATDIPGNREVIEQGLTGQTVPVNNPQELAQALFALIHDAERRQQMGQRAMAAFQHHFDIGVHCRTLAEYYSDHHRSSLDTPAATV
jgi:glycosyltransferase involved in cell wall biosynthesis